MTSNQLKRQVISSLFLLTCISIPLLGQISSGNISGEVRDAQTQQPLPFATVNILGTSLGTAADENGYFVVKNVPPGVYQMRATMMGYHSSVRSDVSVLSSRNKSVTMELTPSEVEMNTVVVTGDHFAKPSENVVSFKTLMPEEIRRSPGSAEDIFRVMQSLPGVATAGGKSAQLIVRGGSPDENLTLLDNVEIYNPIHFARTGESMGIISIINPALLKEVDFMTGGFPAQYGDKMSSVFDMKLQDGNKELYNTDVNLNVAGFGALVDGPLTNGGSIVASARRGFFDVVTSIMNRPASPEYYDFVSKATFDINDQNRISVVGFYYLDKIQRSGTTKEMVNQKYDYLNRDDYGSAAGVNWRMLISPKAYALTTFSFSGNGWNTLQGTQSDPALKGEDIRENEYSIKSNLTYQVGSHVELKTGGSLKLIDSRHTAWTPQDTTRNGILIPSTSIAYLPPASGKVMGFLQSTYQPVEPLSIVAGLRIDHFSFTNETNISPRLGLSLHLTEATSLNGSYGKFTQAPAAYQIALDPANRSLRSSLAEHYIVGIDHRLGDDAKATVELYHKSLSSVIVGNDTTNILTNNGSGYAEGVEFSLQKKFTDGMVGSASYTYSVSKRRDDGSSPLYYFEYDRPHIANIIFGMELGQAWQVGAKFQYASGNPYTPVAGVAMKKGVYYVVDGEYNGARYPDYHKLDIRVDKKFFVGTWTVTAYLDLWNVYNRQNVLSYSYKVDTNGVLTESSRLDFGLLPIVGVTAQW